jgi:hypothetical protein
MNTGSSSIDILACERYVYAGIIDSPSQRVIASQSGSLAYPHDTSGNQEILAASAMWPNAPANSSGASTKITSAISRDFLDGRNNRVADLVLSLELSDMGDPSMGQYSFHWSNRAYFILTVSSQKAMEFWVGQAQAAGGYEGYILDAGADYDAIKSNQAIDPSHIVSNATEWHSLTNDPYYTYGSLPAGDYYIVMRDMDTAAYRNANEFAMYLQQVSLSAPGSLSIVP